MGFLSRGFEEDAAVEEDEEAGADDGDTEDLAAQDKTVFFMTGAHSESVPKLAVVDIWHSEGISKRIQGAMADRARTWAALSDIGLFHVALNAVLLTVCGSGIPGARARVAVFPNKPEQWVLHETQVVEEQLVRVEEAKLEAVLVECKSACFHVTFYVTRSSFLVCS